MLDAFALAVLAAGRYDVARNVVVLTAAITLAALAAHPRVQRLERAYGLTVFLASGLPFLLLGALLSSQTIGLLTPAILRDIQPAYVFGLGWIGFIVGTEFDIRRLSRLPPSLAPVIALFAAIPVIFTAVVVALTLLALHVVPGTGLIRDVLLLCACAAASAPASLGILLDRGVHAGRLIVAITRIDQIASLALLALAVIAFRPDLATAGSWVLPRSAWLLLTLGLGTLFGVLTYLLKLGVEDETEYVALIVAAIALAAGTASYLKLPVPVLTALAGALLVNLPLAQPDQLRQLLAAIERPLYLLFLFVVGTAWRPSEWEAWVLAVALVIARTYGKFVAARFARRLGPPALVATRRLAVALLPESPIAIVVIFSAATLSNTVSTPLRWAISAVILASIFTDVIVQLVQRRGRAAEVST